MRNYKQGDPSRHTSDNTKNRIDINDSYVPGIDKVRTVPNKGVTDAYFAHGTQAHSHHLQSADDDLDMAIWGLNEQARQLQQEDRNHDETE